MTRFWPLTILMLVSAIAVALGTSSSYADSCGAIRSQLLSAGHGAGTSPELAQLRRQLAAIQRLERQRRCTAKTAGFFFNPCADLVASKAEVQRQIARLSNSGRDTSGLKARFVALGCAAPAAKKQPAQQRTAPKTQSAGATIGGNRMLFCVRLSDGYFFPAPKSQFAKSDDLKETVDQCRYICDDADVDLYTLSDATRETEEMIALESGKPYVELPAAFRYRDDANFKACDVKRYYRRVAELRARTVTPANMTNAIIPLPTAKPDFGIVAEIPESGIETAGAAPAEAKTQAAEVQGAAQHQSIERAIGARPVRVVGPAFFPAD
ncbi:MAG: DUF2865 domain-containing protein [Mesorhizobium sp.]|uniref:DUF2865 domain-containing protein n=1 Tax=Mesorhizobium sp. TaxID=1871066 RepID=UPI00122A98BD|nr:DUF2865 domain-containing protein [Mesorhizobium sp.]TIT23759.1 MAG: DUF2865 domain-containing protein [Mesorhizobium sp.]TIX45671.1 MAG: DUF2865 domain-containing protein [Mesorhizobium sp.]